MRLVAQRYGEIGNLVSEAWWKNFLNHCVGYNSRTGSWAAASWETWPSDDDKVLKQLKLAGGHLILTHYGSVIEFDNNADATAFLLRWS